MRAIILLVCVFAVSRTVGVADDRGPQPPGEEWGASVGNLHCRLELQKGVFPTGEPVELSFRIEPVSGPASEVEHLIPYEKEGLIEALRIIGPDGKRLPLKARPSRPPAGRYSAHFDASSYYDLSKPGEYFLTAEYEPSERESRPLTSQTVSLIVVPRDLVLTSIRSHQRHVSPGDPIPATLELLTGRCCAVTIRDVELELRVRKSRLWLWSHPQQSPFPPEMSLGNKPIRRVLDVSSTGWDEIVSSRWPAKSLYEFIKAGDEVRLVAVISGKYKGKIFEICSNEVTLHCAPDASE